MPATSDADAGTPTSCDALAQAVGAAFPGFDNSCDRDEDCTHTASVRCVQCGFPFVLPKRELSKVRAEIEAIERDWCPLLAEKQCGLNTTCPLGPAMIPMCIFAKCEAVVPFAPSCEQMRAIAIKEVQVLVKAEDASCRTNADCVMAPVLSCAGDCGFGVLSKAAAAAIASGVAEVEQRTCKPFDDIGCKVPTVQCPPLGVPTCDAGKCTAAQSKSM